MTSLAVKIFIYFVTLILKNIYIIYDINSGKIFMTSLVKNIYIICNIISDFINKNCDFVNKIINIFHIIYNEKLYISRRY
jgi:hypothetical protein